MPVNAADLPPEVRKRLQEASTPVSRATSAAPEDKLGPGPRYRCNGNAVEPCGQEFERWGAKIERHADEAGHTRFEALLVRKGDDR